MCEYPSNYEAMLNGDIIYETDDNPFGDNNEIPIDNTKKLDIKIKTHEDEGKAKVKHGVGSFATNTIKSRHKTCCIKSQRISHRGLDLIKSLLKYIELL